MEPLARRRWLAIENQSRLDSDNEKRLQLRVLSRKSGVGN